MLRKIVKICQEITCKPLLLWYLRKDRQLNFEGLKIMVKAGVFHPLFFISTNLLIQYLKKYKLKDKSLLEPGSGSGLISVWAAKQGAIVTASDINTEAVANTKFNAYINHLEIKTIESNLFLNIEKETFDFIVINPPYYRGEPVNISQFAWYCGLNMDYFETLFKNLANYCHNGTVAMMVLSQDCEIDNIKSIALKNNQAMQLVSTSKSLFEKNYIFEIKANKSGTSFAR